MLAVTAIFWLYSAAILDLMYLQMPQEVFMATFIMLILLAIVIIAKLKFCKKLYNLQSLFYFLTKNWSFIYLFFYLFILCH